MEKTTILVVEDEEIIAADLAIKLERLGYEVVGQAAGRDEAIELACRLQPQIVLMDIWLKDRMDGIEAAEAIRHRLDVPVVYLTAHSDSATLERAKLSQPFGYILKPFQERALSTAIEIALHRHQSDRQLREQREWLRVTLTSIGDAVITCDTEGRITFLNPVAEALTGWKNDEARELPIKRVFLLVNEDTHQPIEDPVALVLQEGRPRNLSNHTALVARDGREVPVEDSAAPILDADGRVIGVVLVFHDVTEKRRAQEALRQSEERYRLVTQATNDAIWDINLSAGTIQWNDTYKTVFGRPPETADSWQWWIDNIHPEDRERTVSGLQEALDSRQNNWTCDYRFMRVDGNWAHIFDRAYIGRDESGKACRVIGAMLDLTERKQAEDRIRHLASFPQLNPNPIIEVSPLGSITFINAATQRALENLGLDKDDATVFLPQDIDSILKDLSKQEDQSLYRELAIRDRIFGETIHVASAFNVARIYAYDITERKQAEERLEADVTALSRIHALSTKVLEAEGLEPLLQEIMDAAITIMKANTGTLQLIEGDSLRIVAYHGHDRPFLDFFARAENVASVRGEATKRVDRVVLEDVESSALFAGTPSLSILREAGVRAVQSTPLISHHGELLGILTTQWGVPHVPDEHDLWRIDMLVRLATDLIVHKKAEEALKKLNEELENLVAQRTAELREKDQILLLQSRQAAMGEMICNIAHQWRQPLNALGLTIQQLVLYYDNGEFNREFLDNKVLQSMELIQHMSKTIDDFRNYFRPDKEKTEFKVNEAIANTVSLIEDSFKNRHIRIEVLAKDDPAIFGYPNEFAQAVLNILNNAGDALTERAIKDPMVTITICSGDNRAVVTIADNAGGIPEEIIAKIFDPYFTTKGPQHGTGVGLFMSKAIIEKNMGGKLAARNIANGAEFRIEV